MADGLSARQAMALPTQRIRIPRNRSRLDPTPKGWYLIAGILLAAVGALMEENELSRFGGMVCGLTITSLFVFLLLEQFRVHAPRGIFVSIAVLSALLCLLVAAVVPLFAWVVVSSEPTERCYQWADVMHCYEHDPLGYLREDPGLLLVDLIPLALFSAFFAYVFYCNRFYADVGR